MRHSWTPDEDERLRELWMRGDLTADIGDALGRPKNSVIGRAHRLKLPPRASPIGAGRPRPARPVAAFRSAVIRKPIPPRESAAPETPALSPWAGTAERAAPAELPPAAVLPARPGGFSRGGEGCRWPMWGRGRPTHLYCGATQRARPDGTRCVYCAEHAAVAFIVKPERDPAHRVTRSTFAWGGQVA